MLKREGKLLIGILILFLIFGSLMIYSASSVVSNFKYDDTFYYFKRHLLFIAVGFILFIIILKLKLEVLYKSTYIISIISLIFLVLVLFIGKSKGGAKSWITFAGFSFQPSEFCKLTSILFFARILSNNENITSSFKFFISYLIFVFFIFLLIMLQPDFGTGIVIVISSFIVLYLSGGKYKYFISLFILFVIFGIVLIISAPYRMKRITSFIDPYKDPLGSGFQGIQARYAIIPSGLFGLGFNNSIQKHFFLPEPQNDFIFAIICEELGLFGGCFVLLLFYLLIKKIYMIGFNCPSLYNKYICYGIASLFLSQIFINIGVVIGLLPITGITLPFISYGGTSLIISMLLVGLAIKIERTYI